MENSNKVNLSTLEMDHQQIPWSYWNPEDIPCLIPKERWIKSIVALRLAQHTALNTDSYPGLLSWLLDK